MELPEACTTRSYLFLMIAWSVSSSNSSLPSDAEGTLMTLLGLGLMPLPAVIFVFNKGGEDFAGELVADDTKERD